MYVNITLELEVYREPQEIEVILQRVRKWPVKSSQVNITDLDFDDIASN